MFTNKITGTNKHASKRATKRAGVKHRHLNNGQEHTALNQPVIQVIHISRLRYLMLLLWIAVLAGLTGDKFQPYLKVVVDSLPIEQKVKAVITIVDRTYDNIHVIAQDMNQRNTSSDNSKLPKLPIPPKVLNSKDNISNVLMRSNRTEPGVAFTAPHIIPAYIDKKTVKEVRNVLGI